MPEVDRGPVIGAQRLAASWIASLIVSGTPVTVVLDVPKLERMSARTMPLWARTFGPFEPSPGNGPAVSSGMTAQSAATAEPVAAATAEPVAAALPVALDVAEAEDNGVPEAPGAHATIDIRPALIVVSPASLRTWRRSIRVERS